MKINIHGVVCTTEQMQKIVYELLNLGLRHEEISVLSPKDFNNQHLNHELSNKAAEGGFVGSAIGAASGGGLSALAVIGVIGTAGLAPIFAAGPLAAVLAGIGAGGTVGGLGGALIGYGIPEIEAKFYEKRISDGEILITAQADPKLQMSAVEIMETHNAESVCSTLAT